MKIDHTEAIAVGDKIVVLQCSGKPSHLQGERKLVSIKVNGKMVWQHRALDNPCKIR